MDVMGLRVSGLGLGFTIEGEVRMRGLRLRVLSFRACRLFRVYQTLDLKPQTLNPTTFNLGRALGHLCFPLLSLRGSS